MFSFATKATGALRIFRKRLVSITRDILRRALFFDYDRDGQLDLFLTNVGQYTERGDPIAVIGFAPEEQPEQYHYYIGFKDAFAGHLKPERTEPSLLFRNTGENRFVDVTEEVGIKADGWSGDAMPLDANEDGWPDLYVLNMQGHDEYYENDRGQRFIDKSLAVFPRTPWGAMSAQILDFDNDGHQDLYITDMHSDMSEDIGPEREKLKSRMKWTESFLRSGGRSIYGNAFYHRQADGTYAEISDSIGAENYWPWGLSAGDLNADGYEDVFITASMNYAFRYAVNSLLLNDRGRGLSRRRICSRSRATARRPHGHAVVCLRLRWGICNPSRLRGTQRPPRLLGCAGIARVGTGGFRRRRRPRHRHQ